MPGWMQQLFQNGKFWVFAIAIGVSVVGKILKGLEERSKAREAKLNRDKRELEALRTGRPVDAAAPTQIATPQPQPTVPSASASQRTSVQASAREQLEALAAKRRAAIDELQRRRAAQASPQPTSRSPEPGPTTPEQVLATILGIPTPTQGGSPTGRGQAPSRTTRPANRPKPATPQPRGQAQPVRDRRQGVHQNYPAPVPIQRPVPRQAPPSPRPPREETKRAVEVASVAPEAASQTPEPTPSGATTRTDPLGLRSLSRGDLRRAIVLREIMDPPLALRG